MAEKRLVPFISDVKLIEAVRRLVLNTQTAMSKKDIDRNVLDAFSAIFESIFSGITYQEWLKSEETRQTQKSLQNYIGDFHQDVIGGMDGWENLGRGKFVDVRNKEMKIIAEVKNKHNTVTGGLLTDLYDVLDGALKLEGHEHFTAYHVMMITKDEDYPKPFTSSDRTTHTKRPPNPRILDISGFKFYEMITGDKDSLFKLFQTIPPILKKEFGFKIDDFSSKDDLEKIFMRTYKK